MNSKKAIAELLGFAIQPRNLAIACRKIACSSKLGKCATSLQEKEQKKNRDVFKY